ncbi:hypothetical protein B0T14DRAFT_568166 [Immersiella caudata]|uniref:Heterokaryon incompatibility domain-containing protein n=1 Tax=Immersiella caudata TaxID=314043 RepID=A0AA39WJQ7_9PEZI|nr:hypothetical protein B0T14DRAFT_568166 [Immersiella caudata]
MCGSSHSALAARKSNTDALCQPDSLLTDVTKTIIDAITLGRSIGVKDLWVDRLCIFQDDPDVLMPQLAIMGDLYNLEYLTIIAADGSSAHSRLPGTVYWQCVSQSVQEVCSADDSREWFPLKGTGQDVNNHGSRGEGFPAFAANTAGRAGHPIPDLEGCWRLVAGYSKGNLTFQSDAERAFSAIMRELGRSFDGDFFFGLPLLFFDYSLFWKPAAGVKLKCREGFPSWSWLGWRGEVSAAPYRVGPTKFWQPLESGSLGRSDLDFGHVWDPLVSNPDGRRQR